MEPPPPSPSWSFICTRKGELHKSSGVLKCPQIFWPDSEYDLSTFTTFPYPRSLIKAFKAMPLQVHRHNLCKKGNLNTNNNNNGDVIKFVQQLPSTWFVSLSVHTNCSCSKPNLLTVMMTMADGDLSRFAQNMFGYFLKHSHSSSKYLFPAKLAKTCVAGLSPHLQQIVGKLFTKLFTIKLAGNGILNRITKQPYLLV